MRKITAFVSALLVASTYASHHTHTVSDWPAIKTATTFKTSAVVNTWDGKTLKPYQGATANVIVDSERNKAIAHAKVSVPVFGKVDAHVLLDFTKGALLLNVPFISLCQQVPMDKIKVKDVLTELFNPNGKLTTYVGETPAPWDAKTKSWKFNSHYDFVFNNTKQTAQIDTYFAQATQDLKWLHLATMGFAIQLNGLQPATF